jgi:S-DNA-T family DNA segregation ATPase FtsK/SpoIIIE
MLRLGHDDLVVFQTASTAGPSRRGPGRLVVEWRDSSTGHSTVMPAGPDELTVLVDAICEAATGLDAPHRPWLDPLPAVLTRAECPDPAVVGLVDDPGAQTRRPLRWDHRSGNLLLIGGLGSGTTTTAVAVAAACMRVDREAQLYVIDGRGEPALDPLAGLAACGGVVRAGETERLDRLVRRLTGTIDERALRGDRTPPILVLIDGLGAVRNAASAIDRVFTEGPTVGVVCCATTDGTSAIALTATNAERWVFHVDDPAVARAAGLRALPLPDIPGRLGLVGSGLVGQVVHDPDLLAGLTVRAGGVGLAPIEVLPEIVEPDLLEAAWQRGDRSGAGDPGRDLHVGGLLVGLGADDLEPATLHVPDGDHIFIGGAARTGTSTALRQIVAAWRMAHPSGVVVERPVECSEDPGAPPILVVVDDADQVDDPDGELAAIVAGRRPGVTIAAAARLEAVRVAYGHWVRDVTRSRCGLIMTAPGEVDGELLGVTLPRRTIVPARPGLAWLIDGQGHRLVQVAARMPT